MSFHVHVGPCNGTTMYMLHVSFFAASSLASLPLVLWTHPNHARTADGRHLPSHRGDLPEVDGSASRSESDMWSAEVGKHGPAG